MEAAPAAGNRDWIACEMCRHRSGVGFDGLDDAEAAFMTGFKLGRQAVPAGGYVESAGSPMLLTLYSGLALRVGLPGSGTPCAMGLAFPGDLIGFETLVGPPVLRLRALTDLTYCQFDPDRWTELLAVPSLAERLLRAQALAARETAERLAVATCRSAVGRLCHFVLRTYEALLARKLVRGLSFRLPLPRQELADLLGFTPVHLRRVLATLARDNVLDLSQGRVAIHDLERLRVLAGPLDPPLQRRPLL